jgi:uncharacterized protein HemY
MADAVITYTVAAVIIWIHTSSLWELVPAVVIAWLIIYAIRCVPLS